MRTGVWKEYPEFARAAMGYAEENLRRGVDTEQGPSDP
jgi:hypothetical protein